MGYRLDYDEIEITQVMYTKTKLRVVVKYRDGEVERLKYFYFHVNNALTEEKVLAKIRDTIYDMKYVIPAKVEKLKKLAGVKLVLTGKLKAA